MHHRLKGVKLDEEGGDRRDDKENPSYRVCYRDHMSHIDLLLSLSPDGTEELLHHMYGFLKHKTVIRLKYRVGYVRIQELKHSPEDKKKGGIGLTSLKLGAQTLRCLFHSSPSLETMFPPKTSRNLRYSTGFVKSGRVVRTSCL